MCSAAVCLGWNANTKTKLRAFAPLYLFAWVQLYLPWWPKDLGQVANINIVTGVGFIGAGVIFKDNIAVSGLTTAAVIWISAAIGMAAGSGNYMLAIVSTVLTLTVLMVFNLLERYIDKLHRDKLFNIVFNSTEYEQMNFLENTIESFGLKSRIVQITKKDECLQTAIIVTGHRDSIRLLDQKLLQLPQIKSF